MKGMPTCPHVFAFGDSLDGYPVRVPNERCVPGAAVLRGGLRHLHRLQGRQLVRQG
jgi:hypothetical protein